MIEKDSRAAKHIISLSVFLYNPISILLCNSIRTIRVERSGFFLWNLLYLAIKFRSRSLVNPACLFQSTNSNRFQNSENSGRNNIRSIFRYIKGYLHMTLSRKIIYFIGLYFSNQLNETNGITQISKFKIKVGLSLQVCNTLSIVHRRAPNHTIYLITFL